VATLGAELLDSIHAAALADPDAMRTFANDISLPAEPVQDYLTELDTRRELFDELRAMCQHYEIPPIATILAVFMVAPVSEIRAFFDSIRRESGLANTVRNFAKRAMVYGTLTTARNAIRACTFFLLNLFSFLSLTDTDIPKGRSPNAPAYPPPPPQIAAPSALLNEPGMPVSPSSVIRSGFADRVRF